MLKTCKPSSQHNGTLHRMNTGKVQAPHQGSSIHGPSTPRRDRNAAPVNEDQSYLGSPSSGSTQKVRQKDTSDWVTSNSIRQFEAGNGTSSCEDPLDFDQAGRPMLLKSPSRPIERNILPLRARRVPNQFSGPFEPNLSQSQSLDSGSLSLMRDTIEVEGSLNPRLEGENCSYAQPWI